MKKNKVIPILLSMMVFFTGCFSINKTESENLSELKHNVEIYQTITTEENLKQETNRDTNKNTKNEDITKEVDIELTFLGDCILATNKDSNYYDCFRDVANKEQPSYFFEKVKHVLDNDSFTIANLECVLSDSDIVPVYKDYSPAFWFKGPTKNVDMLTEGSIEVVSLSNNHTYDYGKQGIEDTKKALNDSGIKYGNEEQIVYLEEHGFKIALICHGLWWEGQSNQIIKLIEEASLKSDYQIVMFHGGEQGLHTPEEWKKRECKKIVDGGADLIIGSHPHVLQPLDRYKDVDIAYSIGNFVYGGHHAPENATVIIKHNIKLELSYLNNEITNTKYISNQTNALPTYVYSGDKNNWQPCLMEEGSEDYIKTNELLYSLQKNS